MWCRYSFIERLGSSFFCLDKVEKGSPLRLGQFLFLPWPTGGRFAVWLLKFTYKMWYGSDRTHTSGISEMPCKNPGYLEATILKRWWGGGTTKRPRETPEQPYFLQTLLNSSYPGPRHKWRNLQGLQTPPPSNNNFRRIPKPEPLS